MLIPSDYRELLKLLNKYKAEYLIVGAYAVIYYTEPRFTKDLDIWVNPEIKNARKLWMALKEFGAPLKGIRPEDFTRKKMVYQIGVAPIRVDIITGIPAMEFAVARKEKVVSSFEGIKVKIIGIKELIKSKEKIKRAMDISDVRSLRRALKARKRAL